MNQELVDALQAALAAEHAAIWAYGLAGAFLAEALVGQFVEAAAAHRARRDATERALIDAGAPPVPAEPAYLTPPVDDSASAVRLAVTAETDAAAAWRSVVERSPAGRGLREAALDALIGSAVRAARWRAAAGDARPTVPFPGAP
ncbi:MAG: DUF4439 domain-containing protein [Pseudonocardiaceae bacterium]